MNLTTIIIPTINKKADRLKNCLAGIEACTVQPYEVLVIEDKERRGFAWAVNQELVRAKGSFVCLLNDDTEVAPGWLSRMLAVFEHFPEVGLVGPVSDNVSGPQQREPLAGPISQEVGRLVGFCLLIRREVIDKIGGIDEAYTLGWYSDDDYCLRAQAAGFKLRIALDSFVHHDFAASYKEAGVKLEEANRQGWEVFSRKWEAESRPGGYMVNIPVWDEERCFIPLNIIKWERIEPKATMNIGPLPSQEKESEQYPGLVPPFPWPDPSWTSGAIKVVKS